MTINELMTLITRSIQIPKNHQPKTINDQPINNQLSQ